MFLPSYIFYVLRILTHPTSFVLSQWVPQQASTSVSSILTTLKLFPGTIPPWYNRKPYCFSASALSIKDLETLWPARTILFALINLGYIFTWLSILYSYSLVNVEKWVISKWALSRVFFAPAYHICGPKTPLHEAKMIWVAVWWFLRMLLLSRSISPSTPFPI